MPVHIFITIFVLVWYDIINYVHEEDITLGHRLLMFVLKATSSTWHNYDHCWVHFFPSEKGETTLK